MTNDAEQPQKTICELVAALGIAKGYLLNAMIDLQTGCTNATAIRTIQGGIRMIDKAVKEFSDDE